MNSSTNQYYNAYENDSKFYRKERCYVSLDVECAATGRKHFDRAPCRLAMVDYSGNVLFDVVTKVPNMKDPLIEYTGLTAKEINKGIPLNAALQQLHKILISLQNKHRFGVIIIGQRVENDVVWSRLEKGVHYSNIIDLSEMFRIGKRRYSLRMEAFALLNKQMNANYHNPVQDAKISMRLYKKYAVGGLAMHAAKQTLKEMDSKRLFPSFRVRPKYRSCPGKYNANTCWCGQPSIGHYNRIEDLVVLMLPNERNKSKKTKQKRKAYYLQNKQIRSEHFNWYNNYNYETPQRDRYRPRGGNEYGSPVRGRTYNVQKKWVPKK